LGVGLLTYIVVFNLNRISIIGKKGYEYIKVGTIDKMREEKSGPWQETGGLFRRYEPKGEFGNCEAA
jgi:hypothetical protein